jgi:hypothetical protein
MHRSVRFFRTAAALSAFAAITAAAPAARFHTKLLKSSPAAHDTLATSPKSISLWFSEKVELPMTTVKLSGTGGSVALGAPTRDEKVADAPIVTTIATPLANGSYTVSYTVAGKDGHPTKGTIDFVVKSRR